MACSPQELMAQAGCFACLSPWHRSVLKTYLLYLWSESTSTPQELLRSAGCLACISPEARDAIKTMILCNFSSGTQPTPIASTLLDDLKAYYALEDVTDAVGSLDLTNSGGVTFVAGQVNNCGQFPGTEVLTYVPDAGHVIAGADATIAFWAKIANPATGPDIVCKWSAVAADYEYTVYTDTAPARLTVRFWNAVSGSSNNYTWNLDPAIDFDAWHFYLVSYTNSVPEAEVFVDNVSYGVLTITQPAGTNAGTFAIGSTPNLAWPVNGYVDEVGLWGRLLTAAERDALWNAGVGDTYPF